jgi:hypothetical protein
MIYFNKKVIRRMKFECIRVALKSFKFEGIRVSEKKTCVREELFVLF